MKKVSFALIAGLLTTGFVLAESRGLHPAAAPLAARSVSAGAAPAPDGAVKVWANTANKVYHCEGDRFYGKTRKGMFMDEAEAKSMGYYGEHGKPCAKGA